MLFSIWIYALAFCLQENQIQHKEYEKKYYPNGAIKEEGWVLNSEKIGYWKFYQQNGKLSSEGHFFNNEKDKYWYFYQPNGSPESEGHFKEGLKNGWWSFYSVKGVLARKCQFKSGQLHGYAMEYKNKKLYKAEKYENGTKIGEWYDLASFKRDNKSQNPE